MQLWRRLKKIDEKKLGWSWWEDRYILKEQGLSPVDLLYTPSARRAVLFCIPPLHLRLFQHRRLQDRLCWGHLRSCWDKIFDIVAFPKLTIIWWGSCRFYSSSLQTIRRSKNLWKRQMQLQKRVKSDKKERRETTETSFYEAETDRKRCKIGFTEHLEEL